MNLTEKEFNLQIGLKIKRYRKQLGLSQQELADKLEMSNTTISAYELGKISATVSTLYQFASLFEVDIYDILPSTKQSQDAPLDILYNQLLDMDDQSRIKLIQIIQLSLDLYKHKLKIDHHL